MPNRDSVIVALSGGVDSAVAALLLAQQGYAVECLHMTNWDDRDGYCTAAEDLQDARRICDLLGLNLHRVNFAAEYRQAVFDEFLRESEAGRTPNPDVLCNREIKFGVLRRYASRLGADYLATGHYARLERAAGGPLLFKARDTRKDQSYFLHAVHRRDLEGVLFPLGDRLKPEVRALAAEAGLPVSEKRDSTGICFIGERPFAEFLSGHIEGRPGPIVTVTGETIGTHRGLPFYTLGQRRGLGIGGRSGCGEAPWYVAAKDQARNRLVVVQGEGHPALRQDWLLARDMHWLGEPPAAWHRGDSLVCSAKSRYRQPDQPCTVRQTADGAVEVCFATPQWAITPGQYAVLYDGDRCLGGARIEVAGRREAIEETAVQAG
jgi:tRNA-specific 2-thiouridylase